MNRTAIPATFGSMPRFLGHYVRDLKLMPLEQAHPQNHFPARATRPYC